MLKRLAAMLVVLCCLLAVFAAQAEEEFTFRNGIKFGMSKAEVKALESNLPAEEEENGLAYKNESAAGEDATIIYLFENDRLYNMGVKFTEKHSNENLYINDFENIDEALKAKYGAPTIDAQQVWYDDLYKSDKNDWGFAISCGDLIYLSCFDNVADSVSILHGLQGDNYEISHNLFYECSDFADSAPNTDGI